MKNSNRALYASGAFCLAALAAPVLLQKQIQSLDSEGLQIALVSTYVAGVVLLVGLVASLMTSRALRKKIRLAEATANNMAAQEYYVSRREDALREAFCIRFVTDGQVPDMRYFSPWRAQLIMDNGGLNDLRNKLEQGREIILPPSTMPDEEVLNQGLRSTVQQAFASMRLT